MNHVVEFLGYTLTDDEIEALKLLLEDIRARKEKERQIQKVKMSISFEIANAISEIGVEETKTIVHGLIINMESLKNLIKKSDLLS